MKFLVVEDCPFKRESVAKFLKSRDVDFVFTYSLKPTLWYISKKSNRLSGIVLNLGLCSTNISSDYDYLMGFDVLTKLKELQLNIPVLINSNHQVYLEYLIEAYPFVKGQINDENDYSALEKFIKTLE